MSNLNTMRRLVWIITFREDARTPQQELKLYTEQGAKHFAKVVMEQGGVAVVNETDEEDTPMDDGLGEEDNVYPRKGMLTWN